MVRVSRSREEGASGRRDTATAQVSAVFLRPSLHHAELTSSRPSLAYLTAVSLFCCTRMAFSAAAISSGLPAYLATRSAA